LGPGDAVPAAEVVIVADEPDGAPEVTETAPVTEPASEDAPQLSEPVADEPIAPAETAPEAAPEAEPPSDAPAASPEVTETIDLADAATPVAEAPASEGQPQ
jgi:hypothetical protein